MQNLLRIGYEKILLLTSVIFRGDYHITSPPESFFSRRCLEEAHEEYKPREIAITFSPSPNQILPVHFKPLFPKVEDNIVNDASPEEILRSSL